MCKVNLTGRLQPWVSAKDVILEMLEIFDDKGNVGVVFEYGGPGVATLSVPERATITNMGAELGVTTSLFPSRRGDAALPARPQGRGEPTGRDAERPTADAEYDRVVEIDLCAVEPLAAAPHSPGNVVTVRELAGMKVDQVLHRLAAPTPPTRT